MAHAEHAHDPGRYYFPHGSRLPLFGSTRCDTGSTPPLPGSPVVTVRAFAAFGDVRVRLPRLQGDRRFGRSHRR